MNFYKLITPEFNDYLQNLEGIANIDEYNIAIKDYPSLIFKGDMFYNCPVVYEKENIMVIEIPIEIEGKLDFCEYFAIEVNEKYPDANIEKSPRKYFIIEDNGFTMKY